MSRTALIDSSAFFNIRAASGEMSKAPEDLDELFLSIDNVCVGPS